MRYLIKNGMVIDPRNNVEGQLDILISDGKIEKVGKCLNGGVKEVIDAKGYIVAPGFIDMHTHLREPGREDEETVKTGARAAVKGGYTSVLAMPNTEPAVDSVEIVKKLKETVKKDSLANILIAGAITKGRAGKELVDFSGLKREGVTVFSDDGLSVEDGALLEEALKRARGEGALIIEHCEDLKLSAGGVVNKGFISTKMGLKGISKESEYERVRRDIEIAKSASYKIHIAHVSCKESADLIRKAKRAGVQVSAETCPHYFSLTEDCCVTYDTNTKMNPPLRAKEDVEAVREALRDGTIDAIATDHAPHTDAEKDVEFDFAPFGIIGLETALGLSVTGLVDKKILSWKELILKMSTNPAGILGLNKGSLKEGAIADIVIIDPDKEFIYKKDSIESKSKNSPFIGWKMNGVASFVFVSGKLIVKNGVIMG